MSPQKTPSKEGPDPIHVLTSIIKPGWKTAFFLILPILGLTFAHFMCYSDPPSACINIIRLFLSAFTVTYIGVSIGEAYKKKSDIVDSFQKNQPQFFTIIVVLGGALAILIPMIMNVTKLIGDGAPLTTALLGITGGVIAIFGYYKTHQKSELEREQLKTQKQKDDRDHIRQLHASYNDRFDKAVAELNGKDLKAAYAAVPKLAKLADAWLDYKDLSNNKKELKKLKKKAKKEAQTIINILCKYVRTMPGEYTEENLKNIGALNSTDQDSLKNESEVRRLIFSEMSHRSSKANFENENSTTVPGIWSKFNFDFTGAPIFYPLNNLKIEKGIFTSARFYSNADFRGSTFIKNVDFKGVQFTQDAYFNEATFKEAADFSTQGDTKTTFGGKATFNGVQFTQDAYFNEATFKEAADFSTQGDTKTTFGGKATFNGVQFTQDAYFNEVTFNEVTFNESADLSIRDDPKTVFEGEAVFNDATFNKKAIFHGVRFKKVASFNSVLFYKDVCFKYVTFENNSSFTIKDTDCRKTEFKESANFQSALFEGKTSFKGAIFNGRANFHPNQIDLENTKFVQEADFSDAHFMKGAHFFKAKFEGDALFGLSKFHEDKTHEILVKPDEDLLPFERALIKNSMTHTCPDLYTGAANFSEAEFHGFAGFTLAEFTGESIFTSAKFYQRVSFLRSCIYKKIAFLEKLGSMDMPAHFSNKNNPDDYDFKSQKKDKNGNKLYIIKEYKIPYGDKEFHVPEGCKLFDPDALKNPFGN